MAHRNEHSDEEYALALPVLEAGGSKVAPTARPLSAARSTVQGCARDQSVADAVPNGQLPSEEALADTLEHAAQKLVAALAGKLEAASLQHTAAALGIVIDRMHLLRSKGSADERSEESVVRIYIPANGRDDEGIPPAGEAAAEVLN